MDTKVTYHCSNCGSTNLVWDAVASWDEDIQAFVYEDLQDGVKPECRDCNSQNWAEEKPITLGRRT